MPWGLMRFQHCGQSHFVTFCCYHRRRLLTTDTNRRIFESSLERVRRSYRLYIYGYVIMPEHVHLLLSEPQCEGGPLKPDFGLSGDVDWPSKPHEHTLADALKSLKQGVSRHLVGNAEHFWQKRYYDFNIRNYSQFVEKLRYIHRNPVPAGLCARPEEWEWSALAITQPALKSAWKLSQSGRRENANEPREDWVQLSNCPTQAKRGLEWATAGERISVSVSRLRRGIARSIAKVNANYDFARALPGLNGPPCQSRSVLANCLSDFKNEQGGYFAK